MKDWGNRIIRNTFYLSLIASIIASMTTSIGALVDGVIIGQCLGLDSISAFGLVSPVIIIFSLIGAMVSTGGRNRLVRLVGSGELDQARGVFTLSVVLSVGFAVLIMIVIGLLLTPISVLLGATGNAAHLLDKTRGYLLGIALGLPAMNASRTLQSYMTIDNNRNLPVISAIAMTVSDILLDLFVAFVIHGDTFEMGLATSISHYISLLVLLTHFRRKERLIRFSFRKIPWNETGAILWRGLPNGFGRIANTVRSILINRLLAIAAVAGCIAAYSVHRQADSFLNCLTIGMADVVAVIVSLLAGEENRPMIKRLLKISFMANLTVTGCTAVVFFLISPFFAALFIKGDPAALEYGVQAARCGSAGIRGSGRAVLCHRNAVLWDEHHLPVLSGGHWPQQDGSDSLIYAGGRTVGSCHICDVSSDRRKCGVGLFPRDTVYSALCGGRIYNSRYQKAGDTAERFLRPHPAFAERL